MLHVPDSLAVTPVATKADRKAFVRLPYDLYRGEPAWRPPVRLERSLQIHPKHNKLMGDIDATLFLARRGKEVVGRVASFTNSRHHEVHDPEEGFFGYFDCIDDPAVGEALLAAVEADQRTRGMKRVVGPAQWSVNEEVGLLVDGFEHPNVILMPYGAPRYRPMLEAQGWEKRVDMLAFQADLADPPPRPRSVLRLAEAARKSSRIAVRPIDRKRFADEVAVALEIFNDAWSENWSALPYTPAQAAALAAELKPIMFEGGFQFAEVDGEAVAFGVILPDLYQAVRDLDGRLLSAGLPRALWRVLARKVDQGRLPLMGMRRSHQKTRAGVSAMTLMCEELFAAAARNGFRKLELGWVLESNTALIQITEQVGAEPYKRYRMYGREL